MTASAPRGGTAVTACRLGSAPCDEYAYTARNAIAEVRLRGWSGDPDIAEPVPDDYLVLASYAYDLAGQLVRSTDAMGRATGYSYYNDGLLFRATALGIHNPDGKLDSWRKECP